MLAHRLRRVRGGLTSFTFVTSGNGSTPTITIPGTPTAGDLCVIWNYARGTSPPQVIPSGFTALQENAGGSGGPRGIISAKKLDGTETTVTGMDGSVVDAWVAATFRPNASFTAFAWNSPNGESTDGNPASQTITAASAASLPIILLGQMGALNPIDPRSTSPAMTEIAGPTTGHYVHYFLVSSGPADTTYDMDDEGTNTLQSGYLTFT